MKRQMLYTSSRQILRSKRKKLSVVLRLQLRLGALASDGALDEAVGVGLGSEDRSVLAEVLDALVP